MKTIFRFFVGAFAAVQLYAATNDAPVKLAIISESPDTAAMADVLTAEFTKNDKVHLLERSEIDRVYREQGFSAANRDDVKLGRILGADGLLVIDTLQTPKATNLLARLIAVKPGVVLTDERTPWPLPKMAEWSSLFGKHLKVHLPKLTVLQKDAFPISIVNLRSAVDSVEAQETERQLKTLTIQRLSQERQLFVLERQQMQRLQEEKQFSADASAFWKGSYLLDGTVDQKGYDKDKVILNVQMTPPKGGAAMRFEVSGSRTNLSDVIGQLATNVTGFVHVKTSAPEWKAADEAEMYLAEAKWALQWGMYPEAQSAAEAAWALGKKDLAHATLRIKAYIEEIPTVCVPNLIYFASDKNGLKFVSDGDSPNPRVCDSALHALGYYYEFARTSPDGEPRIIVARGGDWHDWSYSDSYRMGLDCLIAASQVLNDYCYHPESQEAVAEKLIELRRMARVVAEMISKSPSVHDGYFIGERPATSGELSPRFHDSPNIYDCMVLWGCFWQDKPEVCVELYRNLMSSPVFCYIHNDFWTRLPRMPRMAAWNDSDRSRIPTVWGNFVQEMHASTNMLLQFEAQALAVTDAANPKAMALAFTNLFDQIVQNQGALVTNNVEQLYENWGLDDLLNSDEGDGIFHLRNVDDMESMRDSLRAAYDSKYKPMFASMQHAGITRSLLEKQKRYLKGTNLNRILNPTAQQPASEPKAQAPKPIAVSTPPVAVPVFTNAPEIVTNVIAVRKFIPIPLESLEVFNNTETEIAAHHWMEGRLIVDFDVSTVIHTYGLLGKVLSTSYSWQPAIGIYDPSAEKWDIIDCPRLDPGERNRFYHRTVLLNGELFNCDGNRLQKYDLKKRKWQTLEISAGVNYEIFSVNGHLYAADHDMIFEIVDGGSKTRILASKRRQPPASILDTQNLGLPTLFAGPNHSLRVCCKEMNFTWNIHTWTGTDWRKEFVISHVSSPPEMMSDGCMLRYAADGRNEPMRLSFLPTETSTVELDLWQKNLSDINTAFPFFSHPGAKLTSPGKPLWKMSPELMFGNLPASFYKSNLYLLANHSDMKKTVNDQDSLVGEEVIPRDGYNTALYCFSPDLPIPQKVFLNFKAPGGYPPACRINSQKIRMEMMGVPDCWLLFTTNYLFCGLDGYRGTGYKAGIWMLPLKEIQSEIVSQQKQQVDRLQRLSSGTNQIRQEFLALYDRNKNGTLEPNEREEAMDDPLYIGSKLDVIDANHDGWLNADELAWFDAFPNRILEPKEQAGIEIVQYLLAERLLKKHDVNGDGFLDRSEFKAMLPSKLKVADASDPYSSYPDENQDGRISLEEIEVFFKRQIKKELAGMRQSKAPPYLFRNVGSLPIGNIQIARLKSIDDWQTFKTKLENYWKQREESNNRTQNTPAQ